MVTGQKDPLAKKYNAVFIYRNSLQVANMATCNMCTKVVVGQKDQLPKLKHERKTFSIPISNGNKDTKNVPDL